MSLKVHKESFTAWIDEMPGSERQLIVTGEVEAPSLGWKAALVRAGPLGTVDTLIILDIRASPPSGPSGGQVQPLPLRYEESPPARSYRQATIQYERLRFTIEVGRTS